jgi:hypothetical protein
MRFWMRLVLLASAWLFLVPGAEAQGTLSGTVRDSSGGVVPGATVEAEATEEDTERSPPRARPFTPTAIVYGSGDASGERPRVRSGRIR